MLRVRAALLGDVRQDLWPALFSKYLARDAIRRHDAEHVDTVIVKNILQAFLASDQEDPLYRIEKPARILFAQELIEQAARNLEGETRLRDPVGIAFRGQLRQILQPAFQDIQRMQDPQPRTIGELESDGAPLNTLGLQAHDAVEEIDLLDPEPFDALAELRGLRCRIFG